MRKRVLAIKDSMLFILINLINEIFTNGKYADRNTG
jgi:hypothetical protein